MFEILAQSDGDPTIKILIGVASLAIWLISMAASAWKNRQQTPGPRPVPRAEVPQPSGPPPMPGRAPPQQRRQPAAATQRFPQQQQRGQQQRKPKRQADAANRAAAELERLTRPPPLQSLPPAVYRDAARVNVPDVPDDLTVSVRGPKREGPNNRQRLAALLRPGNLRKEFLITEVLQKPVGLRDAS